jgi:hypothetical protein
VDRIRKVGEAANARLDDLAERVDGLAACDALRLDARADELARCDALGRLVDVLDAELHTPPFVQEPDLSSVTMPGGTMVLGFDESSTLGTHGYRSFEDAMRGREAMIKERQRPYLKWTRAGERVVDLGCGRGELLELLQKHSIDALGVELPGRGDSRSQSRGRTTSGPVPPPSRLMPWRPRRRSAIFLDQARQLFPPEGSASGRPSFEAFEQGPLRGAESAFALNFEAQREPIEGVGGVRYVMLPPTALFAPLVISAWPHEERGR